MLVAMGCISFRDDISSQFSVLSSQFSVLREMPRRLLRMHHSGNSTMSFEARCSRVTTDLSLSVPLSIAEGLMGQSYRNLIAWQKSMRLVTEIYEATRAFPRDELYGLTSQLRRAAVSVPSNIAEGQ